MSMILYGVYGPYAPDCLPIRETPFPTCAPPSYYKSDGVFGIMANVLATYVIPVRPLRRFPGKERRPEIFHRLAPGRGGA
jgi:hypothetical protein